MRNAVIICIVAVLCGGGCGSGPKAHRIRADTNDRYYPQRDIHFVEQGHRSRGVLVAVTPGFSHAFEATWGTVLVPVPPSRLSGPVWTGRRADRALVKAIAALPNHRDAFSIGMFGDTARFRFRMKSVWVLGTDPFILGLPAGAPKRAWREFAVMATGVGRSESHAPLNSFVARFVVDEELDQPLDRLVCFPPDFWKHAATTGTSHGISVSVVTLSKPLAIDDALDALATSSDPLRLGEIEQVELHEHFETDLDMARARIADRDRLRSH